MVENVVKVRAKPLTPVRGPISRPLYSFLVLIAVAVAAYLGYQFFRGNAGSFNAPNTEIEGAAGKIIKVPASGDLQAAIDRAVGGDTIELAAGATYKGTFQLRNKPGEQFITIRTAAPDSSLPPPETRLDYKQYAAVLPKLIPTEKGSPALRAVAGAHHYRFIGVEFGPTVQGMYNIIELGTTEETSLDQLPHHIEFDRVAVMGDPKYGQRRGIAANGRNIRIVNSYIAEIKREDEESAAIGIWATDGPIEIINNYLEAAGENILFGGSPNTLKLVAAQCVVRGNHLNKPIEWKGTKWNVKNFLEIKSGRLIKIENNLMTNNWQMAQEGAGVLFRTGSDSGPQAVVEDIEFTNNIVRGSSSAVNLFGGEGQGGRNVTIRNNIFDDISSKKYGGRGFFFMTTAFDNVTIENNTVINDGSIAIAYGDPTRHLTFRNNIVFNNAYGFFGDNVGPGRPALATYFPGAVITNNVIVGGKASDYGTANFYPTSVSQLGFVDAASGNLKLAETSSLLRKGVGGKPIGALLDPVTVGGR
jgi:Right handed beta helix region